MYIPEHFRVTDDEKIFKFLSENSFGAIVSCESKSGITATHLPFVISKEEGSLKLISHLARANPQWKYIEGQEVLVIFQGPHSYISPSLFENELNVPTWNYTAVHCYGRPVLINEKEQLLNIFYKTFEFYEPEYKEHFDKLPEEYTGGLINGITGIEIIPDRVEAKFKLSQNKSDKDRKNVCQTLEKNSNTIISGVSKYMKEELKNKK